MISEKRVKYFLVFLIAIVVIIGAAVRLTGLGTYQTHVDDVGVARTLLYPQMSYDPINKTINDINNPQYNSRVYAMGRIALGYLHYENNNYLIKIIIIPLCGTYAPLQFMSTALLISTAQTYRQILFWGRLPSAILGVLTLFLIILFYRKFPRPQKYYYMLASVALFAFSLESISYAKQMEHYGSGPFAIMMLLILLSIEIN